MIITIIITNMIITLVTHTTNSLPREHALTTALYAMMSCDTTAVYIYRERDTHIYIDE